MGYLEWLFRLNGWNLDEIWHKEHILKEQILLIKLFLFHEHVVASVFR